MKRKNKKSEEDLMKLSNEQLKMKRDKLHKKSLRMLISEGLMTSLTIVGFILSLVFMSSPLVAWFLIATTCIATTTQALEMSRQHNDSEH